MAGEPVIDANYTQFEREYERYVFELGDAIVNKLERTFIVLSANQHLKPKWLGQYFITRQSWK